MPLLAAALLAAACGGDPLPEGTLLVGDGVQVRALLGRLAGLEGTPLGRSARRAGEEIARCGAVEAFCPRGEPCALLERLACAGEGWAAAHQLRGEDGWLLSHGLGGGGRALLRGSTLADGSVAARLELPRQLGEGGLGLLLPAAEGPGAQRLSAEQRVAHLHVRPDRGLDVASLVAAEGWGSRLFALESSLFAATTLEGAWELAVYLPEPGQRIPPLALAVGVAHRQRAVAAMEEFLQALMARWPVRRSPYALAGHQGACLGNLNVMPDLAPCYLATPEALLVGWNPGSLERALAPSGAAPPPAGGASALEVDLALLATADAALATTSGAGAAAAPGPYPWRRLRLEGRRDGGRYALQLALEGAGSAP